mgnify:CR=1 FL=1
MIVKMKIVRWLGNNSSKFLKDMRMGAKLVDVAKHESYSLSDYKKVVLLVTDLSRMEDQVQPLMDWTEKGGQTLLQ